jgi:hypothetical protein
VVDLETLTLAFVDALRAIPELVAALASDPLKPPDPMRIYGYIDNNPDFNSISNAVYEQEPGSVLCGWQETNLTQDEIPAFSHVFQFFVRAPRRGTSALRLLTLLTNGVPNPGDGLRWRYCPVMSGVLPTEITNLARLVDSEGIDYFAVTTATKETGDI